MRSLGYTGHLLERELFGEVDKKKIPPREGHLDFRKSMLIARKAQPYENPSDPDPRFANDLHASVAELLGLEDYENLKIFTGVHSYLDFAHKVDAWLELQYNGRTFRVTLDVTKNPQKDAEVKVYHVVFQWPAEGLDPKLKEDKEEYAKKVDEVAEEVFKVFLSQIEKE